MHDDSDFSNDSSLPFGRLLTRQYVLDVLRDEGHQYRSRTFTPLTTLWAWITQCVSRDKSLNDAVGKVIAHWVAAGLPACSASSASYSDARRRFPEQALARMARDMGRLVHARAPYQSLWRGRSVILVDGTGLSMPDSVENQLEYPKMVTPRTKLGFPLLRGVAMISLSTGAVLDAAFGPYTGKGTSESALFRSMLGALKPGDVVLGDKYYSSYYTVALLAARGVDIVTTIRHKRHPGKTGVTLFRKTERPEWLDAESYAAIPDTLPLRLIDIRIEGRDGQPKTMTIATTIADRAVTDREITNLYRQRWNVELDLRSIKCTMELDVLRAKTPEMIRKELSVHLLSYNLLRGVMAEAAAKADLLPRQLSITGAMQMVESFTPAMMKAGSQTLNDAFLAAIATHRVGNRPNRHEPRFKKRRPRWDQYMTEPRHKAFRRLASGGNGLT